MLKGGNEYQSQADVRQRDAFIAMHFCALNDTRRLQEYKRCPAIQLALEPENEGR